jgi:hypothetical protein
MACGEKMLHQDALRWLNTLRLNERLKLKHIPISIAHELIELGLARVRGGNLVITSAGMNGSPSRMITRPKLRGYSFL